MTGSLLVMLTAASPGPGDFLSLPDLIEQSLKNNPGVAASSFSVDAAKAKVPQAGSLPDPMLMLGVMSVPVDTFRLNQEPMTQIGVGWSQTFPYPGKLDDASASARSGSKAAERRDTAVRQETVAQVRSTYYDLVFLDQAIVITKRNKDLAEQLAQIARARYEVGMGAQPDVLKAQVSSLRVDDDLIVYEKQRDQKAAQLTRLTNGDPTESVGPTRPGDTLPRLPGRDDLFQAARQNNPTLLFMRALAEQAGKDEELARLSWKSDVTVGLNYGIRQNLESGGATMSSPDLLSATVAIPLPLWKKTKQDQGLAQKLAERRAADQSVADVETRVIAEVDSKRAEADATLRQISLLETGIIPEARLSLESSGAGYQTGKIDFLAWLDNQTTLYELEIRLADLKAGYLKALAELDMLTGKPIDEIVQGGKS